MKKDRTGSDRNASGCMHQAAKFGDIDLLLRNSIENPSKRKSIDEILKMIHDGHQGPPSISDVGTITRAAGDTEIQMMDEEEYLDAESSTRIDNMEVDGADDSWDNQPLMKHSKSGQAGGKKPSGNVHPMTRRNSEKSQ